MGNDWAWRIPSYLQALSSVIQILACYFIVESPRWLVSKGKDEKAREILIKYHANGDPQDPIVAIELEEIRQALWLEEESLHSGSYTAFFKTRGNRRRFLIILAVGFFSQWSGNGIISYYLTYVLDSIGYKSEGTQTLINGILTIWNLVTSLMFALVVNKFGRRTLFLTSTGLMLICFISTYRLLCSKVSVLT
jgi:Na+/melibiose symporter-like transporter